MSVKLKEAQNPLLLRCHRLMDAFARSDDERDFYLDRVEGFIVFADLDKGEEELRALEDELKTNAERYCAIPKLTFYESKKIMEGFVNEKVYDIDTKEKLLDIIQSKEAREHFLEFLYDHHSELEKWQQYYQERSRIRIIEWLRNNGYQFVFEEDLDMPKALVEKLKSNLFQTKVPKELVAARKALVSKAETYYSNEALNPRPKRGRPPKQVAKVEIEPQFTADIYLNVPSTIRPFLYVPDITNISSVTFSTKHDSEEEFLASLRNAKQTPTSKLDELAHKLASLRSLSSQVIERKLAAQPSGDARRMPPSHEEPISVLKKSEVEELAAFLDEELPSPKKKAALPITSKAKETPKKERVIESKKQRARPLKAETPQKKKNSVIKGFISHSLAKLKKPKKKSR